jgi:hypothetical protein
VSSATAGRNCYKARQRCHFPAALVIGDQALLLFQSTSFYALSPSQSNFFWPFNEAVHQEIERAIAL